MIVCEIIQKHGAGRIEQALPAPVGAVLNACIGEVYAVGMARDFGGVLRLSIIFQHSADSTRSEAQHKGQAGSFRSHYDIVFNRMIFKHDHLIKVMAGAQYDHGNIAYVLAHEIGHALDYMRDPDLYTRKSFQYPRLLEKEADRYAVEVCKRLAIHHTYRN